MYNHLPDWLNSVINQERVMIVHEFFLTDKHLRKETPRDFELEWQAHEVKKMARTWGFNAEQRVEQLLIETQTTLAELSQLMVLDAGCGNGLLTEAIACYGARVLGVDLINNLSAITKGRKKSQNLAYMHADINDLPLMSESFDLIFSNGVLHHTPNTKEAFLKLAKLVKPGGKLYIWLYRRPFKLKNRIFLLVSDNIRRVISRLPRTIQRPVVEIFTNFFYLLSRLRKGRNTIKDYNDLLIDVYDSFTPKYRHYHNPIEVAGWFHEAFFSSPMLTHWDNSFGFGMCAIKQMDKTSPAGENFGKEDFNPEIHLS